MYMLEMDDPSKCTAAKLVRFGIAKRVYKIPSNSILLDPYSSTILSKDDVNHDLTALDCSWNDTSIFRHNIAKIKRRLPLLFAGNPINYSKPNKLSTAEALAAACIILGHKELAISIINKFKWGYTFLTLNNELLDDYSQADRNSIAKIEQDYISSIYG